MIWQPPPPQSQEIQDISEDCPFKVYKNSLNGWYVESQLFGTIGFIVHMQGLGKYEIFPNKAVRAIRDRMLYNELEQAAWAVYNYKKNIGSNEVCYFDDQVLVTEYTTYCHQVIEIKSFRRIGSIVRSATDEKAGRKIYICFGYSDYTPNSSTAIGSFVDLNKALGQVKDCWFEFA